MQNQRPDPPPFDRESYGSALAGAVEQAFSGVAGEAPGAGAAQRELLVAFGTLLAERSRVVNLTRLTSPEDMAILHFLDTYYLARALKPPTPRVCDIGTGGGVPGVPLAVMRPDLQLTLIDGTGKKTAFVREAIDALGLRNTRAVQARAEEHLRFNPYGAAVVRAAVAPARLFEIMAACGNTLQSIVFMLGGDGPRIAAEIKSPSYVLASLEPYSLPGQTRERYLATFALR